MYLLFNVRFDIGYMKNDISLTYVALLIPLGLICIIYVICKIVKGEINPYQLGVEKRWWCRRRENPVLFWIYVAGGLLMGLLLIMYAIFSLLAR
jgi:hypothetical protein